MNKHCFYILPLLFSIFLLSACSRSSTTVTTYSEALVTSLTFVKNDSFPGLSEASFTIITLTDTGIIYNRDSLRFGTRIDSVVPRLTFNHTPGYSILICGNDTVIYSGADTVDFTATPCRLYVMASDMKSDKWYDIYVNVHSVDPELYTWECLNPAVFQSDGAESKAFIHDDLFVMLVNNGFSTQYYCSLDASEWSDPLTVSGLPAMCRVSNILLSGGLFYYADGDLLYTSDDALVWTAHDYSSMPCRLLNMLYDFNDSVWCIAQRRSDNKLVLANALAGEEVLTPLADTLPDNFPVSDFGTCVFSSSSLRPRTMVIGGYDRNGNALNTRWNIEYLTGRGYRIADFSIEQPSFASLTGVGLIWYNNEFHLFGSSNADSEIGTYNQLISTDEGLNWVVPDSTKNMLPATYHPRSNATVITDEQHYIYIFGGKSRTATFSDVWRGRLNKTTFPDYED